jgi:phosphate transport system permease protein
MVILGLPLIEEGHFFRSFAQPWRPDEGVYGIYPMIVGTLSISFLALFFAVPLGLGCACLMRLLSNNPLSVLLRRLVEFMTGIPTVIYGFVGVFVLVPFIRELFKHGSGMCILSAALLLSILIAPTMILFFADSFERVPAAYLDAVDALGGTPVQKLIHVVIPSSLPGITAGIVLALGRAMGDTLIALMVAGNAVAVPESVLDSARTLTSHIALIIAADFDSIEFRALFACGIVLYVFTTVGVIAVRRMGAVAEKRSL